MLAFGRDLLSPLLNLGWFVGCLLACWCIGRPYRVAPWSLALGAIALSLPALPTRRGRRGTTSSAIFFLLAAVAIALNAWASGRRRAAASAGVAADRGARSSPASRPASPAGTKLNFLLPCAVLVVGLAVIAPRGAPAGAHSPRPASRRWREAATGTCGTSSTPATHCPGSTDLGPISLPAPTQELGGRETPQRPRLPDRRLGLVGLVPARPPPRPRDRSGRCSSPPRLAGLLLCLGRRARARSCAGRRRRPAWRRRSPGWSRRPRPRAPTECPAASNPACATWRRPWSSAWPCCPLRRSLRAPRLASGDRQVAAAIRGTKALDRTRVGIGRAWVRGRASAWSPWSCVGRVGYPVQRHYLQDRYADPSFTDPGPQRRLPLGAARSPARGSRPPPPASTRCSAPISPTASSSSAERAPRRLRRPDAPAAPGAACSTRATTTTSSPAATGSNPASPPIPPTARWTEGPGADVVLRKPPTVVFRLTGPLDPSGVRSLEEARSISVYRDLILRGWQLRGVDGRSRSPAATA